MLCILSPFTDIFFQLATEEYLLKQRTENFLMIWHSEKSIVVGKHQNAMAEINLPYILKNNIRVARRITGGGTVYHGPGNINFSFINNGEVGKLVDFKKFLLPVVRFLASKNIEADIGSKNELLVGDLKVSGNAEHIHKSRVLHHGTLLYNANLNDLAECLRVAPNKYTDKAVQSNRSVVTNLNGFLPHNYSASDFSAELFQYLRITEFEGEEYQLSANEIEAVTLLSEEKFSTWKWNFGYSPPFELNKTVYYKEVEVLVYLRVVNGCIVKLQLVGSYELSGLSQILTGQQYSIPHLKEKLSHYNYAEVELLIELLF